MNSLVVTLDWVDESTISVTAFGGQARLSDRAKHIGVGLSGCGPAHYDVVSAHGSWTPSGDADQIVANFVGLGCGSIRFACSAKGEPGVPRVVL